eukprot:SAG22_NODE_6203_length_886_cov_1.745870_1_plen_207_part_01
MVEDLAGTEEEEEEQQQQGQPVDQLDRTAARAGDQITATIDAVAGLFPKENPFAAALGAALLLSQKHWPVAVLEAATGEILVAAYTEASAWAPLTPCLAVRGGTGGGDGSGSGRGARTAGQPGQIETLQGLLDCEKLHAVAVGGGGGGSGGGAGGGLQTEIVAALDVFSLLLAAGFDLQVRTESLSFCCASTVFLSKDNAFLCGSAR